MGRREERWIGKIEGQDGWMETMDEQGEERMEGKDGESLEGKKGR